jgi:hypothetical protein
MYQYTGGRACKARNFIGEKLLEADSSTKSDYTRTEYHKADLNNKMGKIVDVNMALSLGMSYFES